MEPQLAMKPVRPRGRRRPETEAHAEAPQLRMVEAIKQPLPKSTKEARVLALEALAEDETNLNQEEITMMVMMTTLLVTQETEIIAITTQRKSLKKRSRQKRRKRARLLRKSVKKCLTSILHSRQRGLLIRDSANISFRSGASAAIISS